MGENSTFSGRASTSTVTLTVLTCKKTLGFVFLLNVCFVLAYVKPGLYFMEDVRPGESIGKNYSESPENKLQTFCESVQTSNRQLMTSTVQSTAWPAFIPGSGSVIVNIQTFNRKKKSKSNGNDIILVFAEQVNGDGCVSGTVIDHKNGSYTGIIRIFWPGSSKVYVKLASTVENTCLRFKALQKYGNIVYTLTKPYGLRALFIRNDTTEMTPCNTNNFIYGSINVCNLTSLNGGMSWFCGNPTQDNLNCTDLNSFSLGPFNRAVDTVSRKDKITYPGHGIFETTMTVNVRSVSTRNTTIPCNKRNPLDSWTEPSPVGYYFKRGWVPANCRVSIKHTVRNYRSCLRNKTLLMLGDSTVRQYVNFFLESVLDLKTNIGKGLTFGKLAHSYHGENTFTNYGITIIYRKQAMPLHYSGHNIPINDILSFPQILDSMAMSNIPSSSLIVLLNYHTHFSAFPPVKYRERLRHLAHAIKRFLERKRLAKVFFKGPSLCISNSKWWDARVSLLFEEILKEEFADIMDRVVYLNVWDIAVAHNVQDVHPDGEALKSQLNQFMSYIC